MFKGYPVTQALRWATVALFLAAGLAGLKQAVLPNLSAWGSHIAAILLCALVVFLLNLGLLYRQKVEQNKLSENIIQSPPEIACVIDGGGKFQQWNANFEAALGYTAQEIAEISALDTIAEDQHETVRHTMASVFTDGMAKAESVLMSKNGSRIPFLLTGVRILLNDQPCILVIAVDLRRIRQVEASLRASEKQYRSLVANIPEAIWKVDAEGNVKFVSPQVETILGYSADEFGEQGASLWFNSVHINDRPRVKQAFDSLLNEGKPYDVECRAQRKNGEWFWAHDRAVVTSDENGVRLATGLLSDITQRKAAEEALQKLASIVEFSEDAIISKNMDGVITSWNRAAENMYGYTAAEAVGRDLSLLLPSEKQAEMRVIMERLQNGLAIECLETRRLTKAGSVLDVSLSISPIKDATGRITEASTIARDITLRKRAEEQLKLQSAALEAAVNAIVITDHEGTIVWTNPAFTTMTGYSKEEVLGKNPRLLKSGVQPEGYYAKLWSTISSGNVWHGQIVNRRKDGTTYTEEMTITPVTRDVGNPANRYFVAMKQDITDRKIAETRVQFLAYYDALTGLPNRTLLQDRVAKALARARRQRDKVALLFLDLDGFKNINDSLGHSFGDLLLQEVAERLRKWGRAQDTVARLGGDEFLIMLTDVKNIADAAVAAERLMDVMTTEFMVQGHSLSVACSIGISIFPEHGTDVETLIKYADAAMYSAKDCGRNNFQFFSTAMNAQVVERLTLENSLRQALKKQELFLVYQPQMDTHALYQPRRVCTTLLITGTELRTAWRTAA